MVERIERCLEHLARRARRTPGSAVSGAHRGRFCRRRGDSSWRCLVTDKKESLVDAGAIAAILEGGPVDFPDELRTQRVATDAAKIKVMHRGGCEHFERQDTGQKAAPAPVVFRWTMRTRIAE
jgi:Family of unknown function (DUF5988)